MKKSVRVVGLAVVWLSCVALESVFACSCVHPAGLPCRLGAGDVVFVGTVCQAIVLSKGTIQGTGLRKFVLHVDEAFAGVSSPQVEILSDTSSCGIDFTSGQTYLVRAHRNLDGTATTGACSGTTLASHARDDIQILRKIAAQKSYLGIFGEVIESVEPGPDSRPTDADLWRPIAGVPVIVAGGDQTRRTITDAEGHFSVWNLPDGVYRVKVEVKPPLTLDDYSPGFHFSSSDPNQVQLDGCPARVFFVARRWRAIR